jgi:hypothetical protein
MPSLRHRLRIPRKRRFSVTRRFVEKAPNFVKISPKLEQKISEFFRRNVAKI